MIQTDFNDRAGQAGAGWSDQVVANGSVKTINVSTTALGTTAGITATLVDDGATWESRPGQGTGNRPSVAGTSQDALFDGIVVTRDSGATLNLSGLTSGVSYRLMLSSNDSHNAGNPGFANGGGTVSFSLTSGGASSNVVGGLTTNNGTAAVDSDYTFAKIDIASDGNTAVIDFSTTNPNGFLPINGLVLQQIPEPSTALLGVLGSLFALRRRR